jgi:thiol:disulfide interchange protein
LDQKAKKDNGSLREIHEMAQVIVAETAGSVGLRWAKAVPMVAGTSNNTTTSGELTWIRNDLSAAVTQSQAANQNMFVDFTRYTCTNCGWMEANMFTKPAVKAELAISSSTRGSTDGAGEPNEGYQKMQVTTINAVAGLISGQTDRFPSTA